MNILHVTNISFVIPYFLANNFRILMIEVIKNILFVAHQKSYGVLRQVMILSFMR